MSLKSRSPFLQVMVLVAATVTAYLPAIRGGFVWDDDMHVTRPGLQSLGGLVRIWRDLGATQQYYPVLHSAFWVEHRLWGDAPLGYHLANVLLHAAAAGIFLLLLRRLAVPGAFFAAMAFALHPVCVESVAWISEQKNTLSAVLTLAAALAYLRFRAQAPPGVEGASRAPAYCVATAFFVLALLTKSVAATLPAALLVVFWFQRGRLTLRGDVAPLLPWFAMGAAFGLFTAWVEVRYVGAAGPEFALGALQRVIIAGRALCFYLGRLLWPADLVFIYPRWEVGDMDAWQWVWPLGVLALMAAAWLVRNRSRGPAAALFLFAGTLFPALGFVNVYPFLFSFVADHFQYLAGLGILALAGAASARLSARGSLKAAPAAIVGLLAVLTWRQCGMYRDAATLYQATLERNPGCWMAHNNLGLLLAQDGRVPEAIAHFREALRLRPHYPICEYNLGNALRSCGRIDEAIASYRQSLREQPNQPEAENNLAAVLVGAGRAPEAVLHYQSALSLRPGYVEARVGLSAAELRSGRVAAAIEAAEEALRLRPGDAGAGANLGNALLAAGRADEAVAQFREVVRAQADSAASWYDLANALVHAGRLGEAVAPFKEATRLRPDFTEAHQNLGAVDRALGRISEAAEQQAIADQLRQAKAAADNPSR